ncbi:MAG: ABC transporter permease subunit [Nitrospinae bacterium]|nr:ABC transporter permease subunit [Nitrospinota bacterium]
MGNLKPLYLREVRSFVSTPIAYLVGVIFLLVTGVFFTMILLDYSRYSFEVMRSGGQYRVEGLTVAESILRPALSTMSFLLLFMLPMFTMKSFSEERKSGTIEILFTYPLRDTEIVLGKFLAAFTVFFMIAGMTLFYQVEIAYFRAIPIKEILTGYFGLALMAGFFISVGIFVSSLTENQVVAGAWTFGLNIVFWMVGWIAGDSQSVPSQISKYLSVFEHFENFANGMVDTRDVVYFVSFTALFLFLTLRVLESRRYGS